MKMQEFGEPSLSAAQIEAIVERAQAERSAYLGRLLRKFPTLFSGLAAEWPTFAGDRRVGLHIATKS